MRVVMRVSICIWILVQVYSVSGIQGRYPIAVFHGLMDECVSVGKQNFTKTFSEELNVYVKCIEVGSGSISSLLMSMDKQGRLGCESLNNDSNFRGDFGIIGIS